MKNLWNRGILVATMIVTIIATVGCGQSDKKGQLNEQPQSSADIVNTENPVPTEEVVDDGMEEMQQTDSSTNIEDKDKETQDKTVSAEGPGSDDGIIKDEDRITYTDHMNTVEYIVKVDGVYEFECEPSRGKGYWDIYVLDERFEDALRYLTSAYEPTLKVTDNSKEIRLKKGQYVYGVCSINSFTDNGETDKGFKCPLTIEYED